MGKISDKYNALVAAARKHRDLCDSKEDAKALNRAQYVAIMAMPEGEEKKQKLETLAALALNSIRNLNTQIEAARADAKAKHADLEKYWASKPAGQRASDRYAEVRTFMQGIASVARTWQ